MNKKNYVQPVLAVYGSVEELTQATSKGVDIDGTYPTHTPVAGHTS